MNSLSVSPVKPPLNPGNLSVSPASATNLSKSALPSNNGFTALNLVPEGRGTGSIPAAPSTPEKSVELTSKPPQPAPTSNGIVSPLPDTGQSTVAFVIPNFSEKNESAQNLSSNSGTTKVLNIVEEPAKSKCDVEENKGDKTSTIETKGSSSVVSNKDAPAQNVDANEIPPSVESAVVKKEEIEEKKIDEKKVDTPIRSTENVQVACKIASAPSVKESVDEPAPTKPVQEENKSADTTTRKEETEDIKKKSEPVFKKKIETEGATGVENVTTENTAKTVSPPKATKRKAKTPVESIAEEDADSRKSKRTRLPTQPYQSPIPELQLIAKLNTPAKTTPKTSSEKIIAFYKNEFLAVRNPEGSFYICQTFQNIHRNSTKIKIRWFSNLPQNIYTPDFYDTTEFDCILTNVTMNRVEKDRWKLPDHEQSRIENILKRALDVEQGVVEQPSVTEEHPDGLDLSLYKDEAQLQKKKKKKNPAPPKEPSPLKPKKTKKAKIETKQKSSASTLPSTTSGAKKTGRVSSYVNRDSTEAKNKFVEKTPKKEKKDKRKSKSSKKQTNSTSSKTDWQPSVKASNSSKVVLSLRKENSSVKSSTSTETKSTKRMSSVSLRASAAVAPPTTTATTTSPAKRRKEEPKSSPSNLTSPPSEKAGKVRNAGSAVSAKINSAALRTSKEKERKTAAATGQRKK